MNIKLLNRLRGVRGGYVAISLLGRDAPTVHRDLDELEAFGFAIERHPVLGAAYRGPALRLCPDQIEEGLTTRRIGRQIAVWSRVSSTNDLAARAGNSLANEGLVVLAEEQTAGRGRRGRSWIAPVGSSLLMSVLIFPAGPLGETGWLTALGSVAVAELVSSYSMARAKIKWPNDVRVDGRKISGILVERRAGAVIGIGLNVNLSTDAFPASLREKVTSIQVLNGAPVDRSELARDLIIRLDSLYSRCLDEGTEFLGKTWENLSEYQGERVRVRTPGVEYQGLLIKLDPVEGVTLENESQLHVHLSAGIVLGIDRMNESAEETHGAAGYPAPRDCLGS